jgi:hypothetical protein
MPHTVVPLAYAETTGPVGDWDHQAVPTHSFASRPLQGGSFYHVQDESIRVDAWGCHPVCASRPPDGAAVHEVGCILVLGRYTVPDTHAQE